MPQPQSCELNVDFTESAPNKPLSSSSFRHDQFGPFEDLYRCVHTRNALTERRGKLTKAFGVVDNQTQNVCACRTRQRPYDFLGFHDFAQYIKTSANPANKMIALPLG